MAKSADAFRTISEVAEWLDTPAHVLRFWESKFAQVKPVKRAGGRRYYRPQDMRLLGGIKKLLHDEGMTIKGVQRLLREKGVKHVAALSQPLAGEDAVDMPPAAEPAQVVDFHRETQPFGGTGDDRTDAAPEPEPAERPAAPEAAAAGWQPPGESPPPEPVPENDAPSVDDKPAPAPDEPRAAPTETPAPASTPDPGTQEPPAPAEPAPAARIPAFLNRPDAPTKGGESAPSPAPAPEPEPTPEAQPEPAQEAAETPPQGPPPKPEPRPAPTPLAADVPETDPGDSDFAEPGLLTRLASVPRPCDAATAKALQPLLPRVQGLLAASGTG